MGLVAVPGLGFMPYESYNIIKTSFKVICLFSLNISQSPHNFSSADIPPDYGDSIKVNINKINRKNNYLFQCHFIVIPHWKEKFEYKDTEVTI